MIHVNKMILFASVSFSMNGLAMAPTGIAARAATPAMGTAAVPAAAPAAETVAAPATAARTEARAAALASSQSKSVTTQIPQGNNLPPIHVTVNNNIPQEQMAHKPVAGVPAQAELTQASFTPALDTIFWAGVTNLNCAAAEHPITFTCASEPTAESSEHDQLTANLLKLRNNIETILSDELPEQPKKCSIVFFDQHSYHLNSIEYAELVLNKNQRDREYQSRKTELYTKLQTLQRSFSSANKSFDAGRAYQAELATLNEEGSMILNETKNPRDEKHYEDRLPQIKLRIIEIVQSIAQRMSADAVLDTRTAIYLDPRYNITNFVYALLNKEYLEKSNRESTYE